MIENEVSHKVIGLAMEVHSTLGPGLLESAYKECLFYKLWKSGLHVEKEKVMPLIFKKSNWIVVIELRYSLKID